MDHAHIAQLVEHTTDTREVPGSIPGVRTLKSLPFLNLPYIKVAD